MKIAYLFGSLNRGGTETLMLDVCKNIHLTDFDAIALYRKGGALEDEFKSTNVPFFKLSPGKNKLIYLWKLRKLLIAQKVDIVHAQQSIDAVYAKIATFRTKIKVIQTLHGYDDLSDKKNQIMSLAFKFSDCNIFVSNFQKEYYVKKYKLDSKNQKTVYNGISFAKFRQKYETPDLLKNIDPAKRGLQICMVGNFVRGREQNTVCRFLKILKESNVKFDFYFVGKKDVNEPWRYDDCVEYCKQNELEECVLFLGGRSDVPAFLQNMDAFVYSTAHDTFGIAVVEAVAVGIPVFVNDWEVMKEITEEGKYATIYKTKDETDLFQKFMLFLQDKESYNLIAKENATNIIGKFSIQQHLDATTLVYKQLNHSNTKIPIYRNN